MSKLILESQLTKEQHMRFLDAASKGSVFLQSTYRHSLLPKDNWLIYMDDAETCFVPLAHKKWMGVPMIFTPVFFRYTEAVGDLNNFVFDSFLKTLIQRYKLIHVNWKGAIEQCKTFQIVPKKHQVLITQPTSYSKLAKRMLNKAVKNGLVVQPTNALKEVLAVIQKELSNNNAILSQKDLLTLNRLTDNYAKTNSLGLVGLFHDNQIVGGLIFIKSKNSTLYLKGACDHQFKTCGGMYLLMDHLVQSVDYSQHYFDFGGSNVEGVQQFNYKFGASDENYHTLIFDKAPLWHKRIRKWRQRNKQK